MAAGSAAEDGLPADAPLEDVLEAVKRDVDRQLQEGGACSVEGWLLRFPGAAEEIVALAEMRALDHELSQAEDAGSTTRETVLAQARAELLDAVNANRRPAIDALCEKHPDLEDEIRGLVNEITGVQEALTGEHMIVPLQDEETLRESALGRYRLLRLLETHPHGPIYLATDEDGRSRLELLVLRSFRRSKDRDQLLDRMGKARALEGEGIARLLEIGASGGVHHLVWEHPPGISLGHALETVVRSGGSTTLDAIALSKTLLEDEARTVDQDFWRGGRQRDLATVLARRPEHVAAALSLAARVAEIVASTHRQGLLHQGICPRAVVIGAEGSVCVRWFRLARDVEARLGEAHALFRYLAPEQILGQRERMDWRSDVFGVGALLHVMLCLEPPRWGFRDRRELERLASDPPAPLRTILPDVPERLAELVDRSLSPDPDDRPRSCDEVAGTLADIMANDVSRPAPRGLRRLGGILRRKSR